MRLGTGRNLLCKKYGAQVTGVDIDPKVFPYLRLHAEINDVPMTTMLKGFDELTRNHLRNVDVMIGADICFWDNMVSPLEDLIGRALDMGVKLVLIADPGRSSFDKFSENLVKNRSGDMWDRTVEHPYSFKGKVMKIGSAPA